MGDDRAGDGRHFQAAALGAVDREVRARPAGPADIDVQSPGTLDPLLDLLQLEAEFQGRALALLVLAIAAEGAAEPAAAAYALRQHAVGVGAEGFDHAVHVGPADHAAFAAFAAIGQDAADGFLDHVEQQGGGGHRRPAAAAFPALAADPDRGGQPEADIDRAGRAAGPAAAAEGMGDQAPGVHALRDDGEVLGLDRDGAACAAACAASRDGHRRQRAQPEAVRPRAAARAAAAAADGLRQQPMRVVAGGGGPLGPRAVIAGPERHRSAVACSRAVAPPAAAWTARTRRRRCRCRRRRIAAARHRRSARSW